MNKQQWKDYFTMQWEALKLQERKFRAFIDRILF
jgi:hypothetical protein